MRDMSFSVLLCPAAEYEQTIKKTFCKKILLLAQFYEGLFCCGKLPCAHSGKQERDQYF